MCIRDSLWRGARDVPGQLVPAAQRRPGRVGRVVALLLLPARRSAQPGDGLGEWRVARGPVRGARGVVGVAVPAPRPAAGRLTRGAAPCLLYTSDAADDLTRVDLCGR